MARTFVDGHREASGIDAENLVLALVPLPFAADQSEVPRSHLAGGQRQAAALLAFEQPRVRVFEFGRALARRAVPARH